MASLASRPEDAIRKVTLVVEGAPHVVDADAWKISTIVNGMINGDEDDEDDEDDTSSTVIAPLINVDTETFNKLNEFVNLHKLDPCGEPRKPLVSSNLTENGVSQRYANWVSAMGLPSASGNTLYMKVLNAADYLDIHILKNLLCAGLASAIRGKTPDEVRAIFQIPPGTIDSNTQRALEAC